MFRFSGGPRSGPSAEPVVSQLRQGPVRGTGRDWLAPWTRRAL